MTVGYRFLWFIEEHCWSVSMAVGIFVLASLSAMWLFPHLVGNPRSAMAEDVPLSLLRVDSIGAVFQWPSGTHTRPTVFLLRQALEFATQRIIDGKSSFDHNRRGI